MQREFTSLRIPVPAHTPGTRKLDSARHKTEEKKMFWRQWGFFQEKEQHGYKIMHFHTKFISILVLQAVLAY